MAVHSFDQPVPGDLRYMTATVRLASPAFFFRQSLGHGSFPPPKPSISTFRPSVSTIRWFGNSNDNPIVSPHAWQVMPKPSRLSASAGGLAFAIPLTASRGYWVLRDFVPRSPPMAAFCVYGAGAGVSSSGNVRRLAQQDSPQAD